MAKIKTSELKGVALDWAVAKCAVHLYEDQEHCIVIVNNGEVRFFKSASSNRPPCQSAWSCPLKYSTDWSQSGPIIEREKICFCLDEVHGMYATKKQEGLPDNVHGQYSGKGTTPLEAAMRCYVASKLGNEVEVPDELIGE